MIGEHYHGRQIIAKGMENIVLGPVARNSEIVIKVSRPANYLSMIGRDQAAVLRKELNEAQALVEGTNVQIPRTVIHYGKELKVLGLKTKGYVIGQRFIQEDHSVASVGDYLSQQGLTSLVHEHKHEPNNFVTHNSVVYWIDPTKGTVGRVLEDLHIMKLETYRKVRQRFSKVIRFIGL